MMVVDRRRQSVAVGTTVLIATASPRPALFVSHIQMSSSLSFSELSSALIIARTQRTRLPVSRLLCSGRSPARPVNCLHLPPLPHGKVSNSIMYVSVRGFCYVSLLGDFQVLYVDTVIAWGRRLDEGFDHFYCINNGRAQKKDSLRLVPLIGLNDAWSICSCYFKRSPSIETDILLMYYSYRLGRSSQSLPPSTVL